MCYTSEVMAKIEIAGAPAQHLATLLIAGTFYSDVSYFGASVVWDSNPFVPAEEQLAQIEERWQPKAAKGYFPGPVARLKGYRVVGGTLRLSMHPTTFKEYVGLQTNDDAAKFRLECLANPLSVSLAILTADEQWAMAKKRQGDRIGAIDAVGGYVNPKKDVLFPKLVEKLEQNLLLLRAADKSGFLKLLHQRDVWRAIKREYREETGALADSILTMTALGLTYEHKDLNHPVLNVFVRSELTSDQLRDWAPKNGDGEVDLLFTSSALATIQEMRQDAVDIEPDGQWNFALAQAYSIFATRQRVLVDNLDSDELKIDLMTGLIRSRVSGNS